MRISGIWGEDMLLFRKIGHPVHPQVATEQIIAAEKK